MNNRGEAARSVRSHAAPRNTFTVSCASAIHPIACISPVLYRRGAVSGSRRGALTLPSPALRERVKEDSSPAMRERVQREGVRRALSPFSNHSCDRLDSAAPVFAMSVPPMRAPAIVAERPRAESGIGGTHAG
jgi:hypothetical protein